MTAAPKAPDFAAQPPPSAGNDTATLVRLERFRDLAPGGDAATTELVELFLEQMIEQLPHLRDAVERGAAAEVELIAHRCAGTAATCGADPLARLLLAIERVAHGGTVAGAADLLVAADTAFARVRDFLAGYLAGLRDRTERG
jgi:HPt (histidine-containing phosphotransfer) domain-containing protein